jgi:dihydrolipoamide dehydrogenase
MANEATGQTKFDLVIVGGGPGGYTGAIRAAQLGLKTAIIEKRGALGGTCLNVGCIPSKALLDSSEHFSAALRDFSAHGIKVGKVELDLPAMMARKDKIVKELTAGVAFLMKKNKIESFEGTGRLVGPGQVEVALKSGGTTRLAAKSVLLATGSAAVELPFAKFDGKVVVSSTEALTLPKVPKHLVVIGGGYIGLEMGSVWLRLGAKVSVIEYAPNICGTMDLQISKLLQRSLEKQGMEFRLGAKVTKVEVKGAGAVVSFEDAAKKAQSVECDVVLVAAGRKAYSDGLGLEAVGVKRDERGRVEVDEHFRASAPGIFAVGDLIRGPMLAHKAEEEGVAVAEIIAGKAGHVNYETVPGVIYTWPEAASVGQTEEQLKERAIAYKSGTFPFAANGRAKALGMTDGLVKILADAKTDRILGVHIMGPRASDMIAEAVVAMEFGGSAEDIARSFHGHPTLSEAMREAALAVDKAARQL